MKTTRDGFEEEPVKQTKILSALIILLVLAASGLHVGCAGNADAASDGEDTAADAQPAKAPSDDEEAAEDDGEEGDGEDAEEKKEEAVPVEVAELALGSIESVLRFSANLEAENQVQVYSQAKRLVTELLVEEGDRVRKDAVLLRLQDEEQRSALDKVRSQLAKAEREYKQQERLFQQKLISQQAYDDATYELDQLQIALVDAERELGYTEVRAPISGTVTQRMVNLGDQVQIGDHLFEIIDFDSMGARIFVPEKHLGQLRQGLGARLSAQATGGDDYRGNVSRIAPIVDPKSGTVKVTIDVGGQQGLRPGMYVDVDLITATRANTVLVPKRAVIYDNDQMFVFRLGDEKRVERIFIEAQLSDRNYVEPLEGLDAGDRIVVAGQAGLKDGALVRLPGEKDDEEEQADREDDDDATAVERASL
jgi:membrane fusion protein (multidrug efflux system)